ncbi:MAG: hypothetical protein MJ010_06295 [Paludibacteraceae bacterium]|nr:hypothetical protein [Paludibacteraceae bacterium]
MKKTIFIIAALMTAMCAMAQEKFYVYMNDGTTDEYTVADCDSISFTEPKAPTTGTAKRTGDVDVTWVQLWENGPKFAEYNVGATKVEEYGGYYAWGGSQDKVDDHYTGEGDIQGGNYDTAKNLWGSNWQMVTKADYEALLANCDVEWKSKDKSGYGVAGMVFTGKDDYAGNSVFFPAAGYYGNGQVNNTGSLGYCWSSAPNDSSHAYYLYFNSGSQGVSNSLLKNGYSVRAILAE